MRKMTLRQLLASSVAAGALSLAAGAAAQAEAVTYDFDQPAMPMSAALQNVGRETGVNILVDARLVKDVQARGLKGQLSADDALVALLSGTGLTIRKTDQNSVMIVSASAPQSGSAAGDGADAGTVQALIVTAQKREEDIQDVPIAISAFTQEDLTRSQVAGGPDLVTQVPNFTFTKTNFSSYSIQIRGIGTQAISATTDPAVAVAFNNTPFVRNRFFEQEFYDLQRVEVLRGPQGTLYGRNATAGVVNIISQKPKFTFEAKASADVSNFNSSRIEGMVNIPLADDAIALRVAGAWTKRDGYATNQLTGNPIDGRDLWSTRVSLRVAPTDRLDVNLIWEHFEEDDDRLRSGKQLCKKHVVTEVGGIPTPDFFQPLPDRGQNSILSGVQATFSQGCERASLYATESFQTPNGLMLPYYLPLSAIGLPTARLDPYVSTVQSQDLRVIESTTDPRYSASSDIGELQISFDLSDSLTLSSETSFSTDNVYSLQDFNRFNTASGAWRQTSARPGLLEPGPDGGIFCDPQLGCSDRLVAVDISTANSRQFSQEFRLSSNFEGPLNFSLGANFLRYDTEDKYYVFINSLTLAAASPFFSTLSSPYVAGKTDHFECLDNGYNPGDPEGIYRIPSCVYIDPNPLESVNDQGHNYFLSKNPYKLISYAVFGEAYYQIADNLKVTGGLRWTVDKKDAPRVPTWLLAGDSYGYPVAEVIEQEWREPTGRVAVDWKPSLTFTDETLIYGSYAHGYKAGGANPPGYIRFFYSNRNDAVSSSETSATRPKTFEPEFVDAFELGSKNTLLNGLATLNLAAFYYDYTGYQVSEIVDRSAFNRNFDAKIWGVELESDWRPLDNLKLGLKIGYENTRIADGERAIDLMDRTAGNKDWRVVRPFPTYASSCILPVEVFVWQSVIVNPGGVSGGNPSACELAYTRGVDPVTDAPYVPNPGGFYTGYAGFNPLDESQGHNGGEGFFKQLGGNQLPNAPHWTGTVTGDYTLPLASEWLMTLHTDVHWQSQSWWRVFNDHVYDKLHPYFTMNLAAIFTNEEQGWNIMAYIKNVTDETAITGAFLNSDDTGLTTNVFLTEPRLYGLRITKAWTGGAWGGLGEPSSAPNRFTVEVGGHIERNDAPGRPVAFTFEDAFADNLRVFEEVQQRETGWGDGGEVTLSYRPNQSSWNISAGWRFGKTKGVHHAHPSETLPGCLVGAWFCEYTPDSYGDVSANNYADVQTTIHEQHQLVDFEVGREVGIGSPRIMSRVSGGLRYLDLDSRSKTTVMGVPNWDFPAEYSALYYSSHDRFTSDVSTRREFTGAGPTVKWDAALPLIEHSHGGQVDLDWSVKTGVLFGKQKTRINGEETEAFFGGTYYQLFVWLPPIDQVGPTLYTPIAHNRSSSKAVPMLDLGLGLSFRADRASVSAGYRWERYFGAIDGGFAVHKDADRTIDGPYFKIAVGFGG